MVWARPQVRLLGSHLRGCEDNDVLDVSPGEAGPHLQHQGYHARCKRGCSRGPRVALSAARALLKVPVSGHLASRGGQGAGLGAGFTGAAERGQGWSSESAWGPLLGEGWSCGQSEAREQAGTMQASQEALWRTERTVGQLPVRVWPRGQGDGDMGDALGAELFPDSCSSDNSLIQHPGPSRHLLPGSLARREAAGAALGPRLELGQH